MKEMQGSLSTDGTELAPTEFTELDLTRVQYISLADRNDQLCFCVCESDRQTRR